MKFSNPVLTGCYPDPSICRVGEDYYLVNSSFGYFPGVPIFHSQDLVNWKQLGHVLNRPAQMSPDGRNPFAGKSVSWAGIYAPTIRHHDGRFYMITTNISAGGNFFVWADRPEGPWSDPVYLDWEGIDPSLLFDRDGRVYLSGTGGGAVSDGIYQAELDIRTGRLLSERRLIWRGTGGSYPEGPHLYHIGDWYYLLIAEGGTEFGHMVTLARSAHPHGPFDPCPHNPILTHRSRMNPIQALGHADWVEAHDGSWWAVCLGIRPSGYPYYHQLGRETYLLPIRWTADGWPVFGLDGMLAPEMEGPSFFAGREADDARPETDTFDGDRLDDRWNTLQMQTLAGGTLSLQERPGWLTLRGTAYGLDDLDALAFVGRRQQHLDLAASTLLAFDPQADGEEAGLTVYMNEIGHYEIAVARRDGQRVVRFRRRIGSLSAIEREVPLGDGAVVLGLRADASTYTFTYAIAGEELAVLGQGECRYIATEVAGGFTGVYIGLYATGNGKPCETPAHFDDFTYQPLTKNGA